MRSAHSPKVMPEANGLDAAGLCRLSWQPARYADGEVVATGRPRFSTRPGGRSWKTVRPSLPAAHTSQVVLLRALLRSVRGGPERASPPRRSDFAARLGLCHCGHYSAPLEAGRKQARLCAPLRRPLPPRPPPASRQFDSPSPLPLLTPLRHRSTAASLRCSRRRSVGFKPSLVRPAHWFYRSLRSLVRPAHWLCRSLAFARGVPPHPPGPPRPAPPKGGLGKSPNPPAAHPPPRTHTANPPLRFFCLIRRRSLFWHWSPWPPWP